MERAKPGFLLFIFISLFLDRALLYSSVYSGTHCVGLASLKTDFSASIVCTQYPASCLTFKLVKKQTQDSEPNCI